MDSIQQTVRRNKWNYLFAATLYTFAANFQSSGFATPFNVNDLGMSAFELSIASTVSAIASMVAYFLLSVCHMRNMKRVMIVSSFLLCLSPLMSILFLFTGRTALVIPLQCVIGAVFAVATACKSTCEYSITPLLFPRKDYGGMTAKCGIIGGIIAIGIGFVSTLFNQISSFQRYLLFFSIITIGYFLSALLIFRYRTISNLEPKTAEEVKAPSKEKKNFSGNLLEKLWMLLPHLLRGIVNVGFGYIMIIALKNFTFSATGQSMLVTISSAALLIACSGFMKIEKHMRSGLIILVSYVILALGGLLACTTKSEIVFLVVYCIYLMANHMKDYAIPVGVMYSVRMEDLPYISSVRMLVVSVAGLVLTTPVAALVDVKPILVISITSLLAIVTGAIFFIQYKDKYKQNT